MIGSTRTYAQQHLRRLHSRRSALFSVSNTSSRRRSFNTIAPLFVATRRRCRPLSTLAESSPALSTATPGATTTGASPTTSTQERADMVATTNRLLDLAQGSFSSYTWRDGQHALDYWTLQQQQQEPKQQQQHGQALLRRLQQERDGLRSRMEAVHGAMNASAMLEQCYPLDEEKYESIIGVVGMSVDSTSDPATSSISNDSNSKVNNIATTTSFQATADKMMIMKAQAQETTNTVPARREGGQQQQQPDFLSELHRMSQRLKTRNRNSSRRQESERNPPKSAQLPEVASSSSSLALNSKNENDQQQSKAEVEANLLRPIIGPQMIIPDDNSNLIEDLLTNLKRDWHAAGFSGTSSRDRISQFRRNIGDDGGSTTDNDQQQSYAQKAFLFVLQAWEDAAKTKPRAATQYADKFLYERLTLYLTANKEEEDGNSHSSNAPSFAAASNIKPCRQCFASLLKAHVTAGNTDAADRVLQDMLRLYETTEDKDFRPTRQDFLAVLLSYFQRQNNKHGEQDKDMVYKADRVLHSMLDLAEVVALKGGAETISTTTTTHTNSDTSLVPPDSLLQHMVALWAESYEHDAGERTECLLLRMQGFRDGTQWPDGRPPLQFFDLLMDNWANSRNPKSAERIEKIRNFVQQSLFANANTNTNTNTNTTCTNINAKTKLCVPPSFGYLPLLRALSRRTGTKPQARSIDKVESIFREYEPYFGSDHVTNLDVILAYKARIHAYGIYVTNSRAAAKRSQAAFNELMQLRRTGVITRDPDATVYGAVANAWAKTGNIARVQQTMREMKNNLKNVQPNNIMYNYLLLALSRSKDPAAVDEAEDLLFRLEEMGQKDPSVTPNIRSYGIVMACLANSPNPKAAVRAQDYLQKLKDLYAATGDDNFKPNTKIYTNAMRALVRSRDSTAPDKARALLHEMNGLAERGDYTVKPDVVTYTTALQVLRRAEVPDKTARAMEIISLMKQSGVEADSFFQTEAKKLEVKW